MFARLEDRELFFCKHGRNRTISGAERFSQRYNVRPHGVVPRSEQIARAPESRLDLVHTEGDIVAPADLLAGLGVAALGNAHTALALDRFNDKAGNISVCREYVFERRGVIVGNNDRAAVWTEVDVMRRVKIGRAHV